MNLKKLQKAHAEYGRRMGGRKYQDVSRSALAYERNRVSGQSDPKIERDEQVAEWIRLSVLSLSQAGTNTVMNEHENIDRKAKTCYALEHRKI